MLVIALVLLIVGAGGAALYAAGRRAVQAHPRQMAAGGLLAAFALLGLLLVGLRAWQRANFLPYLSVSTLVSQVNAHAPRSPAAMQELLRRMDAGDADARDRVSVLAQQGTLGGIPAHELAEAALRHQADDAHPWDPYWPELLMKLHERSLVSSAQWKRYMTQGVKVTLAVRPRVARDGEFVYGVTCSGPRLATNSNLRVTAALSLIDGAPRSGPDIVAFGRLDRGDAGPGVSSASSWYLRQIKDGANTVELLCHLTVADGGVSMERDIRQSFTVTVLPAGTRTVTLLQDPRLRAEIERKVSVSDVWRGPQPQLQVRGHDLPCDLGFEVTITDGTHTWQAGTGTLPGHVETGASAMIETDNAPPFDAKQVDVILRPSSKAAEQTTGITQIWDGTLTIKNCLVRDRPW